MNDWNAVEKYPGQASTELAQRLHDEGLVYAINRLVLHPLGIALAVEGTRVEVHGPADSMMNVTGLALVATSDPEGIVFDEESKARGIARLRAAGHESLVGAVGL